MKQFTIEKGVVPRLAVVTLTAMFCACLLSSCATPPPVSAADAVFRFSVLRYKEPVAVTAWKIDPAQSANPEGAALNITTAMQQGKVDAWLASWDASERPNLSQTDRETLLQKWQSLKNGRISVLGRVVADADVVIELSVLTPPSPAEKIQLPLKRAQGQWWLTSLDPHSEFLNWENSTNKIVTKTDTLMFKSYLNTISAR